MDAGVDALKTSKYVLELVARLPLSIVTLIFATEAFAGIVNEYHKSYVVPQVLVAMLSFVARYRSPLIVVQVVETVNGVADV